MERTVLIPTETICSRSRSDITTSLLINNAMISPRVRLQSKPEVICKRQGGFWIMTYITYSSIYQLTYIIITASTIGCHMTVTRRIQEIQGTELGARDGCYNMLATQESTIRKYNPRWIAGFGLDTQHPFQPLRKGWVPLILIVTLTYWENHKAS